MFVKILPPAATFHGVLYNTNKIAINRAELMEVSGFTLYEGFSRVREQDYVNYLGLLASLNGRVQKPQFHAVLSAQGKTWDKAQLCLLARHWLELMGYGKQPYLLVFHKDTANNHIHMVSVRVDRQGRRIPSAFEHISSGEKLGQLLGIDEKARVNEAVSEALTCRIRSQWEFRAFLLYKGYLVRETSGRTLELIRGGRVQRTVSLEDIDKNIRSRGLQNAMNALDGLLVRYPDEAQMLKVHTEAGRKRNQPKKVFGANVFASPDIVVLFHRRNLTLYGAYSLVWPQAGLIVNEKEFSERMERDARAGILQQVEYGRGPAVGQFALGGLTDRSAGEALEAAQQENNPLRRHRR